jgi:hypothetical protein
MCQIISYIGNTSPSSSTSFPLIRYGAHRKRLQQFFVAAGTSLPSCYLATIGVYRNKPTDKRKKFYRCGNVFFSRCLAMKGGIYFTEPLPSNDRKLHILTHRLVKGIYEVCR